MLGSVVGEVGFCGWWGGSGKVWCSRIETLPESGKSLIHYNVLLEIRN